MQIIHVYQGASNSQNRAFFWYIRQRRDITVSVCRWTFHSTSAKSSYSDLSLHVKQKAANYCRYSKDPLLPSKHDKPAPLRQKMGKMQEMADLGFACSASASRPGSLVGSTGNTALYWKTAWIRGGLSRASEKPAILVCSKSNAKVLEGSQAATCARLSYSSSRKRWPKALVARNSGDVRRRSNPPRAWGADSRL